MSVTPPSLGTERLPSVRDRAGVRGWFSGGPDGNEQLTSATGALLLILLAALGVTIVSIGQLISEHLFIGLLLLGPVVLKMASTGYRFVRYYIQDQVYVRRGPPELWLRLLAPAVVATTLAVFATGVWLLIVGPAHRDLALLLHKVTFFLWLGATGLHVLGHLPQMPRARRAENLTGTALEGGRAGGAGRTMAITGAVVAGLVLAIALIPDFSAWTSNPAIFHHHHDG